MQLDGVISSPVGMYVVLGGGELAPPKNNDRQLSEVAQRSTKPYNPAGSF